MSSLNKVLLIGRVGKDPELRHTTQGKAVANFSIATQNITDKSNSGYGKDVEWHNITVWDKLAENCNQYLKKGKLCYIEGRIATREYQDKEGKQRTNTVIVAQIVQFLSPKDETAEKPQAPAFDPLMEDMPF